MSVVYADDPSGVVQESVVNTAEHHEIVDLGFAVVLPFAYVVDFAPASGVSPHWLTAWSATRPRATLVRMSSAVAVQMKGLGSALCAAR